MFVANFSRARLGEKELADCLDPTAQAAGVPSRLSQNRVSLLLDPGMHLPIVQAKPLWPFKLTRDAVECCAVPRSALYCLVLPV